MVNVGDSFCLRFISTMIVIFFVVYCLCQAEGGIRNLIFEHVPSTTSLSGLSCALEKYNASHARGVKFDSGSGTCEALQENWFSNQTFENDKTFYKLRMENQVFKAGPNIELEMPPDFTSSGSSVVLDIYVGDITSVAEFSIDLKRKDGGTICYHVKAIFESNKIVFNTFNGNWSNKLTVPSTGIFTTSYTTYRCEIRLTPAAMEFYVDGALVNTYQHRMPITDCETIHCRCFHDSTSECQQIQYFYSI